MAAAVTTHATDSADVLDAMTRRLVAALHPERIILFGSHAWGTPHADSDVDLLVILPDSNESPRERALRARQCLRDVPVPKDVLVKTRAEVERGRGVRASLVSEILERGRVLYG
jgi:predicted nucleotidyltransferase